MIKSYLQLTLLLLLQQEEQYLEKRLEKLDVRVFLAAATKNGFTMESLYGMSHSFARGYFYLCWESH